MSNRYTLLENRILIAISGEDPLHFLQGLITQDVAKIHPNHTAYSALLNAQGKFLYDFFLIDRDEAIWLECDRERADELAKLLALYRLRAKVEISLLDQYHILAAQGDMGALSLPEHTGRTEHFHDNSIIAFIDPRLATLGARIIAPIGEGESWLQERGFAAASQADYEEHRLALGIPESPVDSVPGKTLILENGLDLLNGVSFEKGCYVGQEVTSRTKHRANLRKHLYCVSTQNASLPPAGTAIEQEGKTIGEMRSSLGNKGIAVIRDEAVAKDAQLHADGVMLTASKPAWFV